MPQVPNCRDICLAVLPHPQNGYRGAHDRVATGASGLEGRERGGMGTKDLQWRQLAFRRTGAEI